MHFYNLQDDINTEFYISIIILSLSLFLASRIYAFICYQSDVIKNQSHVWELSPQPSCLLSYTALLRQDCPFSLCVYITCMFRHNIWLDNHTHTSLFVKLEFKIVYTKKKDITINNFKLNRLSLEHYKTQKHNRYHVF